MTLLTYRQREKLLEHAASFIGIEEYPLGSNHGKWIDGWVHRATGINGGIPWCACFAWCMVKDIGGDLTSPKPIEFPASVLSWVQWADQTGRRRKKPSGGFLIAYSWHGPEPDPRDHIGFIEKVLHVWPNRWYLRTVEGNAGDAVRREWRMVDARTVAFIQV